jgi:hypothetical protein
MTDWKSLQDTNPEPSLLDAIAHAEKVNIYRVKADAQWLPYEVIFDGERLPPLSLEYPQVYRDDIDDSHDDWETRYLERMREVVGKPVEVFVIATDELGAFAQAVAVLDQHKG